MTDLEPYSLCHKLARFGLWLDPLRWTAVELKQLGCRFENIDPDYTEYVDDHDWTSAWPWSRVMTATSPGLAELLASHPNSLTRLECLAEILRLGEPWEKGPFPGRCMGPPFFFQNRRPRHSPPYSMFFHTQHIQEHQKEDPPRFVGFFDYEELRQLRATVLGPPKRRHDAATGKFWAVQLARSTPPTWTLDPYLLFLLLALAQSRHPKDQGALFHEAPTSRLLVHNWKDDPDHIYLYEAKFGTELIDALMHQYRTTVDFKRFAIQWKRISLRPYDTFAGRLQDQLVNCSLGARESDNRSNHTSQGPIRRNTLDIEGPSGHGRKRRPKPDRPLSYQTRRDKRLEEDTDSSMSEDYEEDTDFLASAEYWTSPKDAVLGRTRSQKRNVADSPTEDKTQSTKRKKTRRARSNEME